MKELPEIAWIDLDNVTGGGLRSWSFGALSALSIGMGSGAGEKMTQPVLSPTPTVQTVGPKR